jgi:hypothetical protein
MKTIVKSGLIILLGILFSGGVVVAQAQEQTQSNQTMAGTQFRKPVLTESQKAILKNNLQKRRENRKAFRATLTLQQKNMLTDPRMMKVDRIKAFRASLTDQQVNMIKTRQQEIKAEKNQFRSTLSPQQKIQFKKMAVNKRVRMNKAYI